MVASAFGKQKGGHGTEGYSREKFARKGFHVHTVFLLAT